MPPTSCLQQVVVDGRCRNVARHLALLVLEGRIGTAFDEHPAQLKLPHDSGIVQGSIVFQSGGIDVGPSLDQCQGHIVVTVVARFVQGCPTWKKEK